MFISNEDYIISPFYNRNIVFREFLRMGNPLNCVAPEPGQVCKPGGPVPLTRIKTLVSMTTPRDYRYVYFFTLRILFLNYSLKITLLFFQISKLLHVTTICRIRYVS